jgi:hypothetical protein
MITVYDQIDDHYQDRPDFARRRALLALGQMVERDSIQFWSSIAECPPGEKSIEEEDLQKTHE